MASAPAIAEHKEDAFEDFLLVRNSRDSFWSLLPPELLKLVWVMHTLSDPAFSPHQRLSVTLIGYDAVGKTSIITRYVDGIFGPACAFHLLLDLHRSCVRRLIDERIYEMEISDPDRLEPRGQTVGRESACIVVYDITDKPSFDNAPYWLRSARGFAPRNCILCAAKSDLAAARAVTTEEGSAMAKAHSVPFIEVSAKEDVNIQQLFALTVRNTKPVAQLAPVPVVPQARPAEDRSGCTIM